MTEDPYAISTLAQLRGHYDLPHSRVTKKVADRLGPRALAFIAASPFAILGTCRHTSPRGDAPGVRTEHPHSGEIKGRQWHDESS